MFEEAEHLVISKQPLTTHTCPEHTGFEVFGGILTKSNQVVFLSSSLLINSLD